jgi:NAD(P)-dependent dehydrogenase (short-subunit alcohol dehydrogenase family)
VVTGASRGIGRAVATAFAAGGDRVAIHHRNSPEPAERLRAELPGDGHAVVQADLADPGEVRRMIDSAAKALGGIDVLVNTDSPAYGASKAGMNALGQSLAIALAPRGITVGTVAPGFVETDMTNEHLKAPRGDAIRAQSPFGRVAMPEEIAAAVLYLASPAAEWASGTEGHPRGLTRK